MDKFFWTYKTPGGFSDITMFSDGEYLTGLIFGMPLSSDCNRWSRKRNATACVNAGAEESAIPEVGLSADPKPGMAAAAEAAKPAEPTAHANFQDGNGEYLINGRSVRKKRLPVFEETARWLDEYFGKDADGNFTANGRWPDFTPPIKIYGLTPFREKVLDIIRTIPFGETMTYGQIAAMIAAGSPYAAGKKQMSAQAVGGAVGWNPICLIIPCHRVMGAGSKLTGYGGGLQNKAMLLMHEGII